MSESVSDTSSVSGTSSLKSGKSSNDGQRARDRNALLQKKRQLLQRSLASNASQPVKTDSEGGSPMTKSSAFLERFEAYNRRFSDWEKDSGRQMVELEKLFHQRRQQLKSANNFPAGL